MLLCRTSWLLTYRWQFLSVSIILISMPSTPPVSTPLTVPDQITEAFLVELTKTNVSPELIKTLRILMSSPDKPVEAKLKAAILSDAKEQ